MNRSHCSPERAGSCRQTTPADGRMTRRGLLRSLAAAFAGLTALPIVQAAKSTVKNLFVSTEAPDGYDPTKHKWLMALDIDRCIGCGLCVEACKRENKVPEEPKYFRTWIERYIFKKPASGSSAEYGEVVVDSPHGGIGGFPESPVSEEEIQRSFFVPKLCNLCTDSPCVKSCPVGATFNTPDGAVLIDPKYCIGCEYCIQACPYGCRFLNPETKVAETCTLCYHRITRGLKPACVEVCPTQARVFGDLMNPTDDDPLQRFMEEKDTKTLKPHLGTSPRVLYAGMDKEVS